MGSRLGRKLAEVRWGVAGKMVIAWVLTLPAAAIVGAIAAGVSTRASWGPTLVGAAGVLLAAGIWLVSPEPSERREHQRRAGGHRGRPGRGLKERTWTSTGTRLRGRAGRRRGPHRAVRLRHPRVSERENARAQGGTGVAQFTGSIVCCAAVVIYGIYSIVA
ncbi:hypothetical protein [Amycolatopsis sulphurea]|uniref:hypothetical protein n=1 Tax=Amycolatopsis sulphurea TaxID=76022 RepID=UPI0036CC1A7A